MGQVKMVEPVETARKGLTHVRRVDHRSLSDSTLTTTGPAGGNAVTPQLRFRVAS